MKSWLASIPLGHWVQIGTMLFAAGGAWAVLRADQINIEAEVSATKAMIAQMKSEYERADLAEAQRQMLQLSLNDLRDRMVRIENKLDDRK